MSPISFSPLQYYSADLCRDRGVCITKFCVQILLLPQGINKLFCVNLVSVTCFEHRWPDVCAGLSTIMDSSPSQVPWHSVDFSAQVRSLCVKIPTAVSLTEPFLHSLYLLGPFPIYPSESSNCLLRGSQKLTIDTSCPFSFNPSNLRLVSHQDNNPICKSATFIR